MTRSEWPDLNSCQLAITNPAFRHLFRNPLSARSGGLSPLLPIRYLKSLYYKDLRDGRSAQGGEAPVLVGAADADKSPSQISRFRHDKYPNKCHVNAHVPDTQNLYVLYGAVR